MTTPKVHLLKRPARLPSGRRVQYWTLRWSDRRGRQRYKSLGRVGKVTRAEAETARREKIVALSNGTAEHDRPHGVMTLSRFVQLHEETFGHSKRPATVIGWRNAGNHAITILGDVKLDDIDWSDAGQIRNCLLGRGASQATVRKVLATLSSMLNRAVSRKMLRENPFANEDFGPVVSRPKRIFTQVEIDAMISVAPTLRWKAMIQLAYTSGIRRAELWYLRWRDFDSEARTVRVEPHDASRYVAKGQDVPILAWKPKTKRSVRTVPVPKSTVTMILRLKMQSDGSPYIFIGLKRLQALDAKYKAGKLRPRYEVINNFNRDFNDIQDKAKAKLEADNWPHACFHDLRKTFATRAAANGVPMHELQAHLGHSSITTTVEYYTDVEKSAADRLRKVFAEVA